MKNPYPTRPGFGLRVAHAKKAIKRLAIDSCVNIFTQGFDNCFENFDGDAVVWALMMSAKTDHLLMSGINRMFGGNPEYWQAIAGTKPDKEQKTFSL
jgi:hypothetical protein